jgi:tetratricopeptide (TPR) repeat protein
MTLPRLRLRLPSRAALGTAFTVLLIFAALVALQVEPRLGWIFLGTALAGTWLGWGLRQAWIYPTLLHRAEARWAEGAPASEVADLLARAPLATGELGYRIRLLQGMAHAALGYRDRAWLDGIDAQLARLPLWKRVIVRLAFRKVPETPSPRRLAWGARCLRLAPNMARLRHLQGILLLRSGRPEALHQAWAHFEAALPLAWDDPLVLEDLMLAGLQHGHEAITEQALRVLSTRHGDPRLPWDRGSAGMHLLRSGRPAEALALIETVPPARRTQPLPWLVACVARRRLGDFDGAWQVVKAAVAECPGSFRLWMERHQVALELRLREAALTSLEQAWAVLPEGPEGEAPREEWHLRRAEFAFWWEDHPEFAAELLEKVSPEAQGHHHPPLRLQLQAALGHFEVAYAEVTDLLRAQPEDPDLLLLQADCMAGLQTWEPLLPFLDGLPERCRERPLYWHLHGLALANRGDHLPARIDLERAVQMEPRDLRFLLDAGHACAELGDWARAEAHWRRALLEDDQSEEALLHLADARREAEDPEGARRFLRECLLHHPDSEEAQIRLAELEAN